VLDIYLENGFELVKVATNGKNPIATDWTNNGVVDMSRWIDWIAHGFNIGVLTGETSNLTVIDLDVKEIPEILANNMQDTLVQQSNKGYHFFYKYDAEIPTTRIDSLKIDILNNKRQCVIAPSTIDGVERYFLDDQNPISTMPEEVKTWLMGNIKKVESFYHIAECKIEEGGRNDSLVKIGGILRKELSPAQTSYVLNVINRRIIKDPLSQRELDAMCKSLINYTNTDLSTVKKKVLDYLSHVNIASLRDLQNATREEPEGLARVVYELQTDGKIIPYRKDFKLVSQPKWKTEFEGMGEPVEFKMPYFHDIANFCYGDMLLIGSQTGGGKTHIAMNIIKELCSEGITPYYITTEAGSRFIRIAEDLGLKEGDFFWDTIVNVENVQLKPKTVCVLDWLMVQDKSLTDKIFQLLQEQLLKSGGVLIVFQQLKDFTSEWFAPNMCKQFPVLATRYIRKKDDYARGEFQIDKIRDAKGHNSYKNIACIYNWLTKELKTVGDYGKAPERDWDEE